MKPHIMMIYRFHKGYMTMAAHGKATVTKSVFRMEVAVSLSINASPERLWAILTDAPGFARWNSTIETIEGSIAAGQAIQLKSPMAPGQVFNLRVVEFTPNQAMSWQDGALPMFKSTRRFTLQPQAGGGTVFGMSEIFIGLMMPMIAPKLPDFGPAFETYANDLKMEAEAASM